MGIRLFEHNQAAYDAAVSMLSESGKAAVIHPIGTEPRMDFLWDSGCSISEPSEKGRCEGF